MPSTSLKGPIAAVAILALVILVVAVLVVAPFTARHRERLKADAQAAAFRAATDAVIAALKQELPHPDETRFGELWLADGQLVCGYIEARSPADDVIGWERFVGKGEVVHRQSDKGHEARAWMRRCDNGRLKLVYPGWPGPRLS